jgi:hypothetical protein
VTRLPLQIRMVQEVIRRRDFREGETKERISDSLVRILAQGLQLL